LMGLERDAFGTDVQRLETRPLNVVCQALGSLEPARESGCPHPAVLRPSLVI
jgi:hypothetical protein